MRLLKLLIFVGVVHLGMACTQVVVSYHGGDVANHGVNGIISHTPIGTFIDLEDPPASMDDQVSPGALGRLVDFATGLGDMINGLATFSYAFLTDMDPDDGAVYNIVVGFRVLSALIWIGGALAYIYFLFDSNLLTSPLGLASVAGLSIFGALAAAAGAT